MYCSRFCILAISFNTALTLIRKENIGYVVIPCDNQDTCNDEMPGSKCINNICVCLESDQCLNKSESVAVRKLGKACKTDIDCIIDNSRCIFKNNIRTCDCIENATPSKDGKACLPLLSELHMPCQEDVQCSKIEHSECTAGVCKCKNNMKIIYGSCYYNKALGDGCQKNEDCKAIQSSECFHNKCVCSKNFVKVEANCLQVANVLGDTCLKDIQCSWNLGDGAACVNNHCICLNTHTFKPEAKKCVQHLMLLRNCTTDKDCIHKENDSSYLKCVSNLCRCKSPYVEFENECVHASAVDATTSTTSTMKLLSLTLSPLIRLYLF